MKVFEVAGGGHNSGLVDCSSLTSFQTHKDPATEQWNEITDKNQLLKHFQSPLLFIIFVSSRAVLKT